MKPKLLIGMCIMILLVNTVLAAEITLYNKDMQQKLIFSPGESMIIKFTPSKITDSATILIFYEDIEMILTDRMKPVKDSEEFGYIYDIPEDITQGDYNLKIMANGESKRMLSKEFFIGQELKGSFVDSEKAKQIVEEKDMSFFQKIIALFKKAWVNIFG